MVEKWEVLYRYSLQQNKKDTHHQHTHTARADYRGGLPSPLFLPLFPDTTCLQFVCFLRHLSAAIKVVLFPGSLFKNGEERAWGEGCNKNRICVSAGACLVTLSSFLNPVITFDSLASCTSVPEWEVASETMCVLLTVISGSISQWAMNELN